MINEETKNKIKYLFSEKKYIQVIKEVEELTDPQERPSGLINLLGISYYLKKNPTKDDYYKSLNCFEISFIKEKNSIHGLNAIKNLVIVAIKSNYISEEFKIFLTKSKKLYSEAETFFGDNNEFLQTGINLFLYTNDKQELKKIIKKILNKPKNSKELIGQSIFLINNYSEWKQNEILSIAKKSKKFFQKLSVRKVNKLENLNNQKIKIGFVSCDLIKNHSVTYFLNNTFKNLDKSKFKIFIFSLNKKNENDLSQNKLRKEVDEWYDLQELNNQEIINFIQDKEIQILFDLVGYTNSKRLEIFNSRVSFIQISWLAYCNTTGFDTVDYLLADKNTIHENEQNLYSEKIIYLPHIWNVHSGFHYDRQFNKLPSLNKKKFTLGSLNNFTKISDEVIEVWSKILKKIDNSNLILKSSNFCDPDIIIDKFKSHGVDSKVIIYNKIDFLKHEDHLNLYKKIDLCLDTFPYNGVTTTFEALWMNVPVLVLKGDNFLSRCGESIIINSKNNFLIANNISEYISKTVFLSENLDKLNDIRQNLHANILSSHLFDSNRFSKNFNETILSIYENHN
tara:strand:+ start:237 stop:1934 length:1698 start_codon:yes stop_codon:yes gene_type:complete